MKFGCLVDTAVTHIYIGIYTICDFLSTTNTKIPKRCRWIQRILFHYQHKQEEQQEDDDDVTTMNRSPPHSPSVVVVVRRRRKWP